MTRPTLRLTWAGIPAEVLALDDARSAIEHARDEAKFAEYLAEELRKPREGERLNTFEETVAGLHAALMQPENLDLIQRLRAAGARTVQELAVGFVLLHPGPPPMKISNRMRRQLRGFRG